MEEGTRDNSYWCLSKEERNFRRIGSLNMWAHSRT